MGYVRSVTPDLAAIRNRRGLSVSEIAATTKIRASYLEAIENGNFEKLPGGVYTKSYIRQYAKAIDFDEAAILQALPPDPEQQVQAPAAPRMRIVLLRILQYVRLPFAGLGTAPKRTG
jgi:cytoskeletal protein RodZ